MAMSFQDRKKAMKDYTESLRKQNEEKKKKGKKSTTEMSLPSREEYDAMRQRAAMSFDEKRQAMRQESAENYARAQGQAPQAARYSMPDTSAGLRGVAMGADTIMNNVKTPNIPYIGTRGVAQGTNELLKTLPDKRAGLRGIAMGAGITEQGLNSRISSGRRGVAAGADAIGKNLPDMRAGLRGIAAGADAIGRNLPDTRAGLRGIAAGADAMNNGRQTPQKSAQQPEVTAPANGPRADFATMMAQMAKNAEKYNGKTKDNVTGFSAWVNSLGGNYKPGEINVTPENVMAYLDEVEKDRQRGAYNQTSDSRMWSTGKKEREAGRLRAEGEEWQQWHDENAPKTAEEERARNATIWENDTHPGQWLDTDGLDVGLDQKVNRRPDDYYEGNMREDYDQAMYDAMYGEGAYYDLLESDATVDEIELELDKMWDRLEKGEMHLYDEEDEEKNRKKQEALELDPNATNKKLKKAEALEEDARRERVLAEYAENAPAAQPFDESRNPGHYEDWGGGKQVFIGGGDKADNAYYQINNRWEDQQRQRGLVTEDGQIIGSRPNWEELQDEWFVSDKPMPNFGGKSERDIFNGYYEADRKDEAMAFLEALRPALRERRAKAAEIEQRERSRMKIGGVDVGWLTGAGATLVKPFGDAMGSVDVLGSLLGVKGSGDPNSVWHQLSNMTTNIRDERGNVWDEAAVGWFGPEAAGWGKKFNGALYSILDNVVAMGAGQLGTAGIADPEKALKATTAAVQWIMSTGAAESTFSEKIKSGMKPDEAAIYAIGNGIIEAITEKYSIEALLDADVKQMLGSGKGVWAFLGKNVLAEGSEEVASDVLSMALDDVMSAINGHESEFRARISELVNDYGLTMEEAKKQAMRETWQKFGESFMFGGLSGFIMSGSRVAINAAGNFMEGRQIRKVDRMLQNSGTQQLIEQGLKTGGQSAELAGVMQQELEGGWNVSSRRLGQLAQNIQMESQENAQAAVKETVEENARAALESGGENSEAAEELAPIVTKVITEGEQALTKAEKAALADSPVAQETIKEIGGGSLAEKVNEQIRNKTEQIRNTVLKVNNLQEGRTAEGLRPQSIGQQMATEDDIRRAEGSRTGGVNEVITDGQFAEITGVQDVAGENGKTEAKVEVKTAEGTRLVNLSEVKATNFTTAAVLRQAAVNPEIYGGKMTDLMLKQTAGGNVQNVGQYLQDAYKIRWAAFLGQQMPQTQINSRAAEELYLQSREDATAEWQKAQADRQKNFRGQGKGIVRLNGMEYGTKEFNDAVKGLDKQERDRIDMVANIAQASGIELDFVDTGSEEYRKNVHGWENTKGITVNLASFDSRQAQAEGRKHNIIVTMGHEMTHWLQRNNASGYLALQDFVLQKTAAEGVNVAARAENLMNQRGISMTEAIDELVANACDQVLGNQQLADELEQNNKGLYNSIKNFVKNIVSKIRGAVFGMEDSASLDARRIMYKYGNELAKVWLGAYDDVISGKIAEIDAQQAAQDVRKMSQAELDSNYMRAVKDGNMDMAAYDVIEAAHRAGYTETAYHGSRKFGFTKFDMEAGQGTIFVAYNKDLSSTYTEEGKVKNISDADGKEGIYELFVRPGKELVVDADGENWDSIYFEPLVKEQKWNPYTQDEPEMFFKTREIADWANRNGYDSVRINHVADDGGQSIEEKSNIGDIGIFFNPSDVKSADTVTYDNNGNVIPPSERFKSNKTDLRFSTAELDSEYDKAVSSGDTARQQELVYEAGRKAGYTIKAFHGTGRADRVGTVFRPDRATSGPMAFFTDNREIAENYARGKQDTSIAYDEEYGDYHNQFRVKDKNGKSIPVSKLWNTLSYREKSQVLEKAKHITWDEEIENIIYDPEATSGNGGFMDWKLREDRGNAIETLIYAWLDGGDLYNQEERFLEVLKLAGIENVTWNNPNARNEKVYDTLLKIQKPFSTSDMFNNEFIDGLLKWWDEQDQDNYKKETASADLWDKNNRTVEEWADMARDNVVNGRTTVWTSIPDAVTDYLKSQGYDGIQDQGGKGGGTGHTVWIPFSSEQVKSADPVTRDDAGNVIPLSERFNKENNDIRYSMADDNNMEVASWMEHVSPWSLQTEGERQLLADYRGKRVALQLSMKRQSDYSKQIAALEAKGELDYAERQKLAELRNRLDVQEQKQARLLNELYQITGSEGYAGMMYSQQKLLDEFIHGKTAEQVTATIDSLKNEAEKAAQIIKRRQGEIERMAENGPVKAVVSALKNRGLARTVDALKNEYATAMDEKELNGRLGEIILKKVNGEDIAEDIRDLAGDVVNNQQSMMAEDANDQLKQIRGMTVVIGPEQQAELKATNSSLAEIRQRTKGSGVKFKFGDHSTLDSNWQEISETVVSMRDKLDNAKDSLGEFVDYIEGLLRARTSNQNEYGVDTQEVEAFLQASVNIVLDGQTGGLTPEQLQKKIRKREGAMDKALAGAKMAAKTAEDLLAGAQRAAGFAGFLHQDVQAAIDYYNKVAKQAAEVERNNVRKNVIEVLRNEHTKALVEQQQKYLDMMKNDRKAREIHQDNEVLRNKVNTELKRFRTLLTAETDKKNIQEEAKPLARYIATMLADHDRMGMRRVSHLSQKDLDDLSYRLGKQQAADGEFDAERDLDFLVIKAPDPADNDYSMKDKAMQDLEDIRKGLQEYQLAERSGPDDKRTGAEILQERKNALLKVQEAVEELSEIIRARSTAFINGQRRNVMDLAQQMQADMDRSRFKGERTGRRGVAQEKIGEFIGYGNLTPEYFVKNLRNKTMDLMMDGFHEAENESGLQALAAKKKVEQIVKDTGADKWDGQEIHKVKVSGGRTVDMTTEQIMSLYATWQREQNALRPEDTAHLLHGGFVLGMKDRREMKNGRVKIEQRPIRMNRELLDSLEDYLTPEQKKYADAIVEYMSTDMAEIGNRASLQTYGIKKFTEKYYFPIKAWGGVLNRSSTSGVQNKNDNAAMRQSFSKRVQANAQNAIEIGDFTATAMKHIVGMIRFNTVGPAVENLNKVLNQQLEYGTKQYGEDGEVIDDDTYKRNIRALFQEKYGEGAAKYLSRWMEDINGGVTAAKDDSIYGRLLGVFRKGAVAGSISVAAQQPLSYIRAAMMVNPKYLAQAAAPWKWSKVHDEMTKYSGVAVIKDMGKFDMNQGRSMIDFISPEQKKGGLKAAAEKVTDWSTKAPEVMDKVTWGRMWVACKLETADRNPGMDTNSEEFMRKVAERFNDLMRKTQVYDSVMVRSQHMRSQNVASKMMTSFMAEPTLTLNVLADAVQNAGEQGGKAKLARAAATFVMSAAAQAAVKAIIGAGRNPDEKKRLEEQFYIKWIQNFLGEVNPMNLVPGYGEIVEALMKGDVSNDAMSVLGKLKTISEAAGKWRTGDVTGYRGFEDTVGQVVQLFTGVPLKNMLRDGRAVYNFFAPGKYADREISGPVIKYGSIDAVAGGTNIVGLVNQILQNNGLGYGTDTADYEQRIYNAKRAGNGQKEQELTEYYLLGKSKADDPQKTLNQAMNRLTKMDRSLSAEEKIEELSEGGYGSMSQYIIEQLADGQIDRKTAEELYRKQNPGRSDKDVAEALDKVGWTGELASGQKQYTNYTPLLVGMEHNKTDEIRGAVDRMLEIGYTEKDIKTKVNTEIKKLYMAADANGRVKLLDAMQKAYKALGFTAEDADKTVKKWKTE